MSTEHLVALLAQDAPIRETLQRRLTIAVLAGAAIAAVLFLIGVGIRPNILAIAYTPRFLFKVLFAATLSCCAGGVVFRVGRPDAELGSWRFVFAALAAALALAVAIELMVTPGSVWLSRLIGQNAMFCLTVIPTLALAPLCGLLVALREGAPARPGVAGAIAGLAASGIAATLYAIHCPDDSPLFVATWYSLATAIVVAVGAVAGSRLLRW